MDKWSRGGVIHAALCIVLSCLLAGAPPALAGSSSPIIVTFAAADSGLTHMTLTGITFLGTGKGSQTIVTLGANSTPLTITALSNNSLTVALPASVAPGSYLLTVSTTNPAQRDEFWGHDW